jgi:nucleoside-diphosphate-sugar epimerase
MSISSPHILLLGGHGKVSLLLTPLLISRNWHVTSLIRNASQKDDILKAAGSKAASHLSTLVSSLEDIQSVSSASKIISTVKPDWIIWSAGAGGKGGPSRTQAIDSDAARYFIHAAVADEKVSKFLMVSALSIRRQKAPWWSGEDWERVKRVNGEVMPAYYRAKLQADECLTLLGRKTAKERPFRYIILRPGNLTDGEGSGKVQLGKTSGSGQVSRADVADVAARLLDVEGANGWFDLLAGEEEVEMAVERVMREGVDSMEGEKVEEMEQSVDV